ncbi:MAG TPA: alpha-E domain-containing protein, partial [Pirellulales bacterium]|nr:alpha-E domain-containing protein [Pirellulales bacterium]
NSILSCLRAARENARTVRELISSSMWEELNKFYLMVRAAKTEADHLAEAYDFFKQVKLSSNLLEGITVATMSHGEAWHFARMGRLLERADKTSRILDVKYYVLLPTLGDVGTPLDTVQWSALLDSASALEMYRKRFGRIVPLDVADFLILDREFPRAIHFCLIKGEESLLAITGGERGRFHTLAEKRLGRLRSELDYTQVTEIIDQGLHEFIDAFQVRLNQVDAAIYETFFALRPLGGSLPASQQ